MFLNNGIINMGVFMAKAVYIHIPFCSSICSYCDFCKRYYDENIISSYLSTLEIEIKNNYKGEKIETLYIGGGTPSVLSIEEIKKLFKIINIMNLDNLKEFTFECNINDIEESKMAYLYENGVNRLSIGVETINNKLLKVLNRIHSKEEIIDKINLLKKIGFKNINIDLMYALPGETINNLEEDLDFVIGLGIQHISAYSLIIDENTKLYIDNIKNINDDLDLEMYNLINNKLEKNGFKHYEISNYCIDGYESKHNLVYWNNLEYYGFGLGATGYIESIRYTNTKSMKNYLKGKYILDKDYISLNEQMENEMILGLRKIKGVNKKEFFKKYNKDINDVFNIKDLIKEEYLIDDGVNIYINNKYLYVQNSILIKFIGGLNE